MVHFWFDGWEPVARVVFVGTLGYVALIVLLRVSGKRTLAQMNSFDFVITVAVGATFARMLTARTLPLAEALTAFALLVLLQYVVTSVQIRSPRFSSWVSAEPTLLYFHGRVLHTVLRRQRITEKELHGAARKHGLGSLAQAQAVVMEPDGKLSVVPHNGDGDGSALPDPPS